MVMLREVNVSIPASRLFGLDHTFSRVSKKIADGDGMKADGSDGMHYFVVGASAVAAIRDSLGAVGRSSVSVKRVLDYACGYGRVLRWLAVYFDHAKLVGVDADAKAATSASAVTGIETHKLDISLAQSIGLNFDVIWVGSLFTHLPKPETMRVLRYLKKALSPTGLLVFTTHGRLVSRRLALRERDYGLSDDSITSVIGQLASDGYGYADYPKQSGYGISVSTPSRIVQMIEEADMSAVYFRDAGWADHQDVFACTPAGWTTKL